MWRRCFFILMACFALSFTAKAQVSPFMEILKRYNNFNFEMRSTPYGQQFNNYGFENWETVSGSSVEPVGWNSFKTAETKNFIIQMGLKDQITKSTEKRPGSSGSYSARIFSTSTLSVIANGNMTTGRIYAGSTTANNDGNYNYTKRSDSNYCTSMTTIPDSLTVWVAFKASSSGTIAKINTTLHGDVDMKQLAKSGDSPADKVCATANQEFTATSTSGVVWKRLSIPFASGPHNDPRYILTTFTTNKTPGSGASGDEMYIDDICLVYNPFLGLDYIAQTEYVLPWDGSSVNIEIPFNLTGSMSTFNLNMANNEVIAQLSDANGSFATPLELGRVTTNTSGTINGVIPADVAEGNGYRVRVVSTNYPMTSADNGTDIVITKEQMPLDPQVQIDLGSVAYKSVSATFTPNSDCAQYYFMIALATENVNAAYLKANGIVKTSAFTKTFENLISNTNYIIYALPIDVEGTEGALKTLAVKTQAFAPQIDITKGNYTAKSIEATFTPNADCTQYYYLIAASEESIDAEYIKVNGVNKNETFTTVFENLTSNTAYTIYALPVDVDGFNGEIKSLNVTTKTLVPQVAIVQGEVFTKSASASFTPNSDCAQYYFMIADATENVNAEYVKANGEVKTDAYTATFEELISNTEYKVYALPIDVEGTEGALISINVTTQAFASQVDITRDNFSAKTITATFVPNADCVEYYYLCATAEEMEQYQEGTYSVDYVVKQYGESQTGTFTTVFENLTSNTAYTIYALPVDIDGFSGEIKTVTVTTKALNAQVEITKGDVLAYSITATFTPNADCAEYYFMIATADEMAEYQASGDSMEDVVKTNGELQVETHTEFWDGILLPNTNYTIYVLPIDIEGHEGALNSLVVKTKVEAGVSEIDIDIEKLTETSVVITATPNENTVLYHYVVVEKEEADAMGEDALMQMLNENENYLTSVDVYAMTVESNVGYYVVAQGKNADEIWGAVTKFEFVVAGPAAVEIEIEKLTETSVEVTATPNENAVSYQYIIIKKAEADAMDEAALMQKLQESNELDGIDVWTYTVESNVEYYVIAQAKNADGRLGEVVEVEFVVAGPATVSIAVETSSETSVVITATPNENAVLYHYIVIEKEEADAMEEAALIQMLNENEDYLEGVDAAELTIESNVEYYVIAQAKNADDKWGALVKVEFVVEVAGPALVAIEVEETSKSTVVITATPNENAVLYHYIIIEKAEAEEIGEDAVMQKLNENENYLEGVDECSWTISSNTEYYVVAQAKNADDKWGEVTKVEFVVEGDAVEELGSTVFEIYPNPAREYVRVTSNGNIEELSVFTVDGKMVYSQNVNQQETMIDVTGFRKGTYIVRMIINDEIVIKRIMVM
ncbi:MAG: T9SS type A sorting domain-containing protein [Bacteroidales bacterium]|nr:T9SS type A sorting domain-containing protein [Bacteroidales bacterium]